MLRVVINGEKVLEYRSHTRLPGHVRGLLARMDADMADELVLAGMTIKRPDTIQCAKFVAMNLLQAIGSGNEGLKQLTCTWLGSRLPELRQITATETGDEIHMQLDLD